MQCDMCGKETFLVVALVEGTELNVCKNCARFGKTLRSARPKSRLVQRRSVKVVKEAKTETVLIIVSDYSNMIRTKRESLGLTQEQFAKKLNEKTSIIQSLETKKLEPSISLAKKLEKTLGIKLIEELDEEDTPAFAKTKKGGALTIGDLIKVRK